MDSKELLRALGLSTYEADVYHALLKLEQAKVQDLTQIVAVPRPQIYVALGALLEKGLCREIRGKVTYYAAVAPSTALRCRRARSPHSSRREVAISPIWSI